MRSVCGGVNESNALEWLGSVEPFHVITDRAPHGMRRAIWIVSQLVRCPTEVYEDIIHVLTISSLPVSRDKE